MRFGNTYDPSTEIIKIYYEEINTSYITEFQTQDSDRRVTIKSLVSNEAWRFLGVLEGKEDTSV